MERSKVESEMLEAVGYDEAKQVLEVIFRSGELYLYHDVPKEAYEGLLAAKSKGRYMHSHIIDQYRCELARRRTR
jgi:hypothetical protein